MRDKKTSQAQEGESGRIHVYVRVRPKTLEESKREESLGVDIDSDRCEVSLHDAKERRYKFDKIFTPQASNREVYNTAGRQLVDGVFSGFNGTLMAYGQTGTGKTHTVMSRDGISVLVVEKLFRRIHLDKHHDYKVYMSYLQIYQEKIYDLLNTNSKVDLVLREDPKKGVYVENLATFIVRDTAEVLSLLRLGKKKLIIAETRMNRASSRSHSVCQITVERTRARGDGIKDAGIATTSESSLSLSTSSLPVTPSEARSVPPQKQAKSAKSLEFLDEESKAKKQNLSLKVDTGRSQSFTPHRNSTPGRPGEHRHSMHLSSLPEISVTPAARPNRWSVGDMAHLLSASGSSLDSPSCSEGSDLQLSVESLLEGGTTVDEGWRSPGSSGFAIGSNDDDDDDESFLEGVQISEDVLTIGKINLCDLAGSERIKKSGVQGERLSELQHLNLSLLELGNTIQALSEGKRTHIPYRNSPLTRLLQDSLGGNCKTSFVLCISPLLRDVTETRCTLAFGQRALKITTTAYVNVEVDYVRLSEDLRKKIEIQELEIKAQKEHFEKQNFEIKSDAEVKLAELQALLEADRDRHRIEIQILQRENENLTKTLFDEKSQRHVLEGMHNASLEAAVLLERQRIQSKEKREKQRLQNALDEEKQRSLARVNNTSEEYERALEDKKRRSQILNQTEQEKLEKSLLEEKKRITELEERLTKSPSHERYTQTSNMLDESEFPHMPPGANQTETLYNVLLAEIMSLQLLYQMQDLSHACSDDNSQSRDSGCADYEEEVIRSVSSSVLEKGGLVLNNLRCRQRGDSRFSLTSTGSLRELYLLQFPPSPKLSSQSQKTGSVPIIPLKNSFLELYSDSKKSFSSMESVQRKRQDRVLNSSMESFLEDELLSPPCHYRPSDSGCSSQHSDYDQCSGTNKRNEPIIDIKARNRANSNPAKRWNSSSACAPLAEGGNKDLRFDDEIQSVKNKVVYLENDLCRLKTELDSETINFFSEVFGVEVPFLGDKELSRVMRHLFEGVKEKLLYRICMDENSPTEEHDEDVELTPPLLEEAVNLLLVNKTAMSCILVLQNKRGTEKIKETTTTELSTVIHAPLKVDRQTQTEAEQLRSSKRRVRKEAAVITDPPIKIQLSNKECQTSRHEITSRLSEEPTLEEEYRESDWLGDAENKLDEVKTNSVPLLSRDPDGASISEECPAVLTDGANLAEVAEANGDHVVTSTVIDLQEVKESKKKSNLFSCFGPSRLSFRKKSRKFRPTSSAFII